MNGRERFHGVMNFEPVDRTPFWEFMGFWPETIDRWHAEGLPAEVQLRDYYLGGDHIQSPDAVVDPKEYFGFDPVASIPIDFNPFPAFEPLVLAEDERTRTVRDEVGVTKRVFKSGSAMPHYVDFPLKTRRDFLAFKERLDPASPGRYPADWAEKVRAWKNRDFPLYLICRGLFAFGRDFMKFDELMMALLLEPAWIREMMEFQTDFMIRLWERALGEMEVDFVYIGEDMAFKNGPMLAPALARELLLPCYRRLTAFLRAGGVRHIIVDSDGDVRTLLPILLEGGVTGILPVERTGGVHPLKLRQEFPKLQMIGALDKQAIARGGEALRREVREVAAPLARQGGFIPGFDHSVHPLTALATYREYLEELRRATRR